MYRRRPRTTGWRKAFAKEKEKETTLIEQLTPSEMLAMEIEYDREPWLERANTYLEDQLAKTQRDLGLQKKMAKHYALRNQIARAKLKRALAKIQALKEAKDQENLGILANASLQASQTP